MEVYRGDIWFIKKMYETVGSEQSGSRPALIVSNDTGNEHSPCVSIVWLTTKDKNPLPTHAEVMCKVQSTALCEQINTISKDRLESFVRSCTKEEMEEIDKALMVSLGIQPIPEKEAVGSTDLLMEIERYKTKMEVYKIMYDELLKKIIE